MSAWDALREIASDATCGLVPEPKSKPAPRRRDGAKEMRKLHAQLVDLHGALCRLDGKLSERGKTK